MSAKIHFASKVALAEAIHALYFSTDKAKCTSSADYCKAQVDDESPEMLILWAKHYGSLTGLVLAAESA